MAQQQYNFPSHVKGDTFNGMSFILKINGLVVDLTGVSITMDVRKKATDSSYVLRFTTTDNTIDLVDAVNGRFRVKGRIIDIAAATYVYDIQITYVNGTVKTYIYGNFEIIQDVTRLS